MVSDDASWTNSGLKVLGSEYRQKRSSPPYWAEPLAARAADARNTATTAALRPRLARRFRKQACCVRPAAAVRERLLEETRKLFIAPQSPWVASDKDTPPQSTSKPGAPRLRRRERSRSPEAAAGCPTRGAGRRRPGRAAQGSPPPECITGSPPKTARSAAA